LQNSPQGRKEREKDEEKKRAIACVCVGVCVCVCVSDCVCVHMQKGGDKGVHRCLQMSMSDIDRVPRKCRWKCRKYIDLSREKTPTKTDSYVEKMQNHMMIYIYIHTHTHPQKSSFFKHFYEKKCKKLGTDSKKCQFQLNRSANVEDMSMSMAHMSMALLRKMTCNLRQMSNICPCRWFL